MLWGDTTGYAWGRRNEKTDVPMQNIKQRQTYYGALNLHNHDFVLMPHDAGNEGNTIAFIKHLQNLNPGKPLILIWDGARYHRSEAVQAYLKKVSKEPRRKRRGFKDPSKTNSTAKADLGSGHRTRYPDGSFLPAASSGVS